MSRTSTRTCSFPIRVLILGLLLGIVGGCGETKSPKPEDARAPKEVPRVVAAEAEGYMSDAMFAVQIKDFARAEQSIAKAVKLRADIPDWWLRLGIARKKQGKSSDARAAYRKALAIHEDVYAKSKDPEFVEGQLYILILLDQEREARSLLEKALRNHPASETLKAFNKVKGIDQLLQDPTIRENKL